MGTSFVVVVMTLGHIQCMSVYVCMYCVCRIYPFNHSYMFGFGCNKNVFCSVVSSVGVCCIILSHGV